jgi:hypothetical protein
MLTANLKFINKNSFCFFFFAMFYITNRIINDSYFRSKYLGALFTENKHVQSCVKRREIQTLHCSKLNVLVSTCFLLDLNQAKNRSNGVLLPSTLSFFALFKLNAQPETFTIEKSGLVDAQTSYKILFTLFYFYQMFWFLWTLFRHDPFKKSPRCHHLVQI